MWSAWAPYSFLRHGAPTSHELGRCGEELAARWLLARGFRLRGRRLRTHQAEVDLWAEVHGVGWVVEVKTGRMRWAESRAARDNRTHVSAPWRPADSFGDDQLRRLKRAARELARRHPIPHGVLLIEVCLSRESRAVRILSSVVHAPGSAPRRETRADALYSRSP